MVLEMDGTCACAAEKVHRQGGTFQYHQTLNLRKHTTMARPNRNHQCQGRAILSEDNERYCGAAYNVARHSDGIRDRFACYAWRVGDPHETLSRPHLVDACIADAGRGGAAGGTRRGAAVAIGYFGSSICHAWPTTSGA